MKKKDELVKKMTNDELLEHLFTKKGAKTHQKARRNA